MKTVQKVSENNVGTWDSPNGMMYKFRYDFMDGTWGIAQHKTDAPKFNVGNEVEVEVTRKSEQYGDTIKIKKPDEGFKGGGYKKPQLKLVDAKRMSKSNAIHAIATVNSNYSEQRIPSSDLKKIEAFTLGGISGDIDKFAEEDSLFTSRLSAVNNASLMSGYESYKDVSGLLKMAESLYKYITS